MTVYNSRLRVEFNLAPYRYHQIAWKGFMEHYGKDAPFILHVDPKTCTMWIRSTVPPTWPPYFNVDVTSEEVAAEGRVEFSILLDPVKRSDRGERHLTAPEEVMPWAQKLLEANGIRIIEAHLRPVTDSPRVTDRRNLPIHTAPWEFRIQGEVAEQAKWVAAVINGIGRKKRFGFGMPRMNA